MVTASQAWDAAHAAGDASRLAQLYDEEAVSMPPGLPALATRATITQRKGGSATKETGKHIVVYRRQSDGSWKVLWEIWNRDD